MSDPSKFDANSHEAESSRVATLCKAFKQAWVDGKKPQIQTHLADTAEPERSKLLRALLAVELECRREKEETLTFDEYAGRFPADVELVRVTWLP